MPYYIFTNEKTGETKEIFQHMNEEHSYSENGVQWKRVYTRPQASFNTRIDPFNSKQFVNKTGQTKGALGDLMDASNELSEKRKQIAGIDPVKETYYENYKKKRNNKEHPDKAKENLLNSLPKGIEIEL